MTDTFTSHILGREPAAIIPMTIAGEQSSNFHPFFDPLRDGHQLSWGKKIGIALSMGAAYLLLQYYALPDKMDFFTHYCWVLGIIISTAMLALYISTEIFRRSLDTMQELEAGTTNSDRIVNEWLSNKWYLIAGLFFATLNTSVGHLLGIPTDFYATPMAMISIYSGMFAAGFTAGMGLLGILAIIVLYLRFAPNLHHALDPLSPDGTGGIKKLGDSLWFFGALTGLVGILVSIYMFQVRWTNMYKDYVQIVFLFWVSLPYLLAISIVLIPGLAVRRQVSYYKMYKVQQLKREKSKLYSSYKKFDAMDDDALIHEKKELKDRLDRIQNELEKLKQMRNSHLDR